MKNRLFIIFITNFSALLSIVFFFEFSNLKEIIGYTDWEFYREVLINNRQYATEFGNILTLFNNLFGEYSIFAWYLIFIPLNTLIITKIQIEMIKNKLYYGAALTLNPFIYILFAGIFKEGFLAAPILILIKYANKLQNPRSRTTILNKLFFLTSSLLILSIRSHLIAFILSLIFRRQYKFYLSLVILVPLAILFDLFPYETISGSFNEMKELDFKDLPSLQITGNNELIYLPINILISMFYWIFAKSLFIKLIGIIQFLTYIKFLRSINNREDIKYKSLNIILGYMLFYSMVATGSGTISRIMAFSVMWSAYASILYLNDPKYFSQNLLCKQ